VYDARREAFVLAHVAAANRGPLAASSVRKIIRTIQTQSRRRERAAKLRRSR
jgi:chorismate mutase